MDKRSLGIVAILLLLALLGTIYWGFSRSAALKEAETAQAGVADELEQMTLLRDGLSLQVDSLSAQYEDVALANVELEGSLLAAQEELSRARNAVARIQKTSQNDKAVAFEMRKQIEDLIAVRSDLERSINVIKAENDSLRSRTFVLENQLGDSQNENAALAELNRNMQAEIDKLTLDNFRATAFNVELLKRNGETVTSRRGSARRMAVSFDLANVPSEYQGVRPIYLVVTDEKGTPVTSEKTIPAKVNVNGQSMDVLALETREINIEESQRINLTHQLDQKLNAGFYRAQVFTDVGLLGASSFRLR